MLRENLLPVQIFIAISARHQTKPDEARPLNGGSRNRLVDWSGQKQEHSETSVVRTARISVCMATYNGARFIEQQLESILSQLRADDEVVIVDNGSIDGTLGCIQSRGDNRIRLVRNNANQGVVLGFERALQEAEGDIIFLSDDDDIWAPQKVEKFLAIFESDPTVSIVLSRVQAIDEHGKFLQDARGVRKGAFVPGFWRNVFKNHYQGSAMAFRSSLLKEVLPFPARPAFVHDVWIGTRSALKGRKTVYLDEVMLFYRRHSRNDSGELSYIDRARVRIGLLWAHLRYALSKT